MKKFLERMTPAGRLEYAAICVILCLAPINEASGLLHAAQDYVNAAPPRYGELFTLALFITSAALMLLAGAFLLAYNTGRRLLDRGEPVHRAWLVFVPLYNLYFMVRLISLRGANTPPIHGGKAAQRSQGYRALWWVFLGIGVVLWLFKLFDLTDALRGLPL